MREHQCTHPVSFSSKERLPFNWYTSFTDSVIGISFSYGVGVIAKAVSSKPRQAQHDWQKENTFSCSLLLDEYTHGIQFVYSFSKKNIISCRLFSSDVFTFRLDKRKVVTAAGTSGITHLELEHELADHSSIRVLINYINCRLFYIGNRKGKTDAGRLDRNLYFEEHGNSSSMFQVREPWVPSSL